MVSSRARVLPPQQWAEHKRDIVKLYIDKKYTMKVVREKLAKRGFHASEGQFRTRLKLWGIRKPRQGTLVTAPGASTGQNGNNSSTWDASVVEDDGAIAAQTVEDSQRSKSTVKGSQPTPEEREQAFLVNAAIAPEESNTAGVESASFPTRYDIVRNKARASQALSDSMRYCQVGTEARNSQAPLYSTRYDLVDNEARTSQAPLYSTRYDLVDNEARTSQDPSYSQYNTCASNDQKHTPPFGLQYETSAGYSGHSLGLSLEQHDDTFGDDFWNPTESINPKPDTASRYG